MGHTPDTSVSSTEFIVILPNFSKKAIAVP